MKNKAINKHSKTIAPLRDKVKTAYQNTKPLINSVLSEKKQKHIEWRKNLKKFDANQSFIELPAFKVAIKTSAVLAALIAAAIIVNSNLQIDLAFNGFNFLLEVFRVPLGILAITIPIIALLAANHRSEQTREQIKLANEQNKFSNHFKHIEEFEKHSKSQEEKSTKQVSRKRRLHSKIFPNSRTGDYSLNASSALDIDALALLMSETLSKPDNTDIYKDTRQYELETFAFACRALKETYYLEAKADDPEAPGISKNMGESDKVAHAAHLIMHCKLLIGIFQFDENYTTSKIASVLVDTKISGDYNNTSRAVYGAAEEIKNLIQSIEMETTERERYEADKIKIRKKLQKEHEEKLKRLAAQKAKNMEPARPHSTINFAKNGNTNGRRSVE